MKTTKVLVMAFVAMIGMVTAGCSKDYAEQVIGTYEGTVSMSVNGQSSGSFEGKVVVSEEAENTVTVVLPEVSEGHVPIPAITVDGVNVSKTDNGITLNKVEIKALAGTYEISGDLTGTVDGGKLHMVYTLTIGAMPMPVVFEFTSK